MTVPLANFSLYLYGTHFFFLNHPFQIQYTFSKYSNNCSSGKLFSCPIHRRRNRGRVGCIRYKVRYNCSLFFCSSRFLIRLGPSSPPTFNLLPTPQLYEFSSWIIHVLHQQSASLNKLCPDHIFSP